MILETDIVVVGGGPSGIIAAKAAAKEGSRVILIERYGFLGGSATVSLVVPLMTFHAGTKQVVGGYGEELVQRIVEQGGSIGHINDPIGFGSTVTPVEPEFYKYLAQEFLLEDGVKILFHSEVIGVEVDDNLIHSITLRTRSGEHIVKAKQFIDASGDCDLAYYSGFETKLGRDSDGKTQPMSMMFRLSNVDIDTVTDYMDAHPDQFVIDEKLKSMKDSRRIAIAGFFDIVEEARKNNDLDLDRDRVLLFEMNRRGEVVVNMSRIIDKVSIRDFDLSEAAIIGRRQVFNIWAFLKKYIPGFENTILEETPTQVGVRETRRIVGHYVLTEHDIVSNRQFDDAVALGAWPIDIHSPDGKGLEVIELEKGAYYSIPYRAMIPLNSKNLIVTGKGISTTHEAFASARVSPTSMALGQAAGIAASIALTSNVNAIDINIDTLRERLIDTNQIL